MKRVLKVVITLLAVAIAAGICWYYYDLYRAHPWTRDGQVRAYVVGIAARVNGPMVAVYAQDNQWVNAGEPLFEIDPTDYEQDVSRSEAALEKAKTVAANLQLEVERRRGLVAQNLISLENFQILEAQYMEAEADIAVARAELELARLDLSYTKVNAPVSGYITNLQVTAGTYVHTGQSLMALVDASSFWVSAYFKETDLGVIKPGDRVRIVLMGDLFEPFAGTVESVGWGIFRADGAVNPETQLPMIEPTVDWVRLAQRFPVRIRPLDLPDNIQLRVGQTVSVILDPLYETKKAQAATPVSAEPAVAPTDYPLTLTDGRGDTVTLDHAPQRILSLAPSTTQWLLALGAQDRLVGVTDNCKLPEGLDLPRFSVYPELPYEAILAARPDLVVGADITDPAHARRLRDLGLPVLVLNNDGYDGIIRDGQTLGSALGTADQAGELVRQLDADRDAVQSNVAAREQNPRVLLALDSSLEYAAGPGSYADSLLGLAGAENVAASADNPWPRLSREFILQANPDMIVVTHPHAGSSASPEQARQDVLDSLRADPVWSQLPAVQNGKVQVVDSRLLNIPGPQVGDALKAVDAAIRQP